MEFGVCLPNYGPATSPEAVRDAGQAAEAMGFTSIWATDHILVPQQHAGGFGQTIEALTTLAYLAGLTKHVGLATSVLVLPQRDPILVAKQVAAVDLLSGGRMQLGVGVGWMADEFSFLRSPFRQRGAQMDEWIDVLHALWRGDSNFHGRWIEFQDAVFQPLPAQRGGPPIHVGGNGKSAWRRAIRRGDGWHPTGLGPAGVAAGVARLVELDPDHKLIISVRNRVHLDESLRPLAPRPDGRQYLRGSDDEVAGLIAAYRSAGLHQLVCYFEHQTGGQLLEQMERFATRLMPRFATPAG